jgi:hypothetical protein
VAAVLVVVFKGTVVVDVGVFNTLLITSVGRAVEIVLVFNKLLIRLVVSVVEVVVAVGEVCKDPSRFSNLALASSDSANIIILS